MKLIVSLFTIVLFCNLAIAQKLINKSIDVANIKKVEIEVLYADINIESYDGDQVIISGEVDINIGLDNEAFNLTTETKEDRLKIHSSVDGSDLPKRIFIIDEKGNKMIINKDDDNYKKFESGDLKNQRLNYGMMVDVTLNITIPTNMALIIKTTYGNVNIVGDYSNINADITYGDIDLIQKNIPSVTSIDVVCTYGYIDYSLPSSANMYFDLSTSYGEILTDLDVKRTNERESNMICYGRSGKYILNGGGSTTRLEATYDKIYLRSLEGL